MRNRARVIADHFAVIMADVVEVTRANATGTEIPIFTVRGHAGEFAAVYRDDTLPRFQRMKALRRDHTWINVDDTSAKADRERGATIMQALPPL